MKHRTPNQHLALTRARAARAFAAAISLGVSLGGGGWCFGGGGRFFLGGGDFFLCGGGGFRLGGGGGLFLGGGFVLGGDGLWATAGVGAAATGDPTAASDDSSKPVRSVACRSVSIYISTGLNVAHRRWDDHGTVGKQ